MGLSPSLPVVALGCLVLAVTLVDILTTVLHPSTESLVAGRVPQVLRYLAGRIEPLLPRSGRGRPLGWILPLSITALLALWLTLLIVGFGLLYLPEIADPNSFRWSGSTLGLGDAFYFSGVCLTSIGFGDIVPRVGWLRAAAVAEGLSGLLVLGVAVTYVLSVYPVLPVARVLASTLNEETGGQVDAVPMVRRYLAADSTEALAARCRELATQVAMLAEAHTTHPVLFYAHPRHVERSFLRVLLVTQRLVAVLRYGLQAADYPTLARDPRVAGLEETLIGALRSMGASLHLDLQGGSEVHPDAIRDTLRREYAALMDRLAATGLRHATGIVPQDRAAYVRFRMVTDPYILAYWRNSGYRGDDVWGDHPPFRGTTAPLPEDDDLDV